MDKNASLVKIAIVDSGSDNTFDCQGCSIVQNGEENNFKIANEFKDQTGHGTIVKNIIKSCTPNLSIFVLKLFDSEYEEVTTEKLIFALKYLLETVKPDIVHLSLGVSFCDNICDLYSVCKSLSDQGSIIVAAYDNNGALSYPALFPFVIGVESNSLCIKKNEYFYIKNSPINISAIGVAQRLKGINNKYVEVFGSSFAAPYITGIIAKMLISANDRISLDKLHTMLESKAKKVLNAKNASPLQLPFNIYKAIVFPFNKEISTMLLHHENIVPAIAGVYDVKYLKNIGKCVNLESNIFIRNVEQINWDENFDTVILGHLNKINSLSHFDYTEYIVKKCAEFGKRIYSFDDISAYTEKYDSLVCFTPQVTKNNVPYNCDGKLRQIGKPILCVAGTSSSQGKFSLQLDLINLLKQKGLKTGFLSTEPSGYLLGSDVVFPMGYNSAVEISDGNEVISTINSIIGSIEDTNPDIIITGLQSQTIQMQVCNLRDMVLANHYFLLGVNPDALVLVVNLYDDIDYIRRTISYLESIVIAEVISIVIFPILKTIKWGTIGNLSVHADINELKEFKNILEDEFSIPVFILDDDNEKSELSEQIISYFT